MLPRRDALKSVAAGLSLGLVNSVHASSSQQILGVGIIGCGGRGRLHARLLAERNDVHVVAVCDPDLQHVEQTASEVEQVSGKKPESYRDLRQVLDREDIDAVIVATPDHWHAPATILACQAGKHVYVEKPCSHNVREGRLMIEASRRHQCVVQVGTQSRNLEHVNRAMQLLHEGAIGEVLQAKAWNSQRRGNIGFGKPEQPPEHLDYDLWLGPAPYEPYHANRLHYHWHWRYAFGTGDIGNDGVHELDLAIWGLGVDGHHPQLISAIGNKLFFEDDQQFPDTQNVTFEYQHAEGQRRQLMFEQRIWAPYRLEGYENGNAFYGTKGYLMLGKKENYRLYGERNRLIEEQAGSFGHNRSTVTHHDDFLNSIRQGVRPRADIEIGHYSAAACHLGNIASRLKRTLQFDGKQERFVNDREANELLTRSYRENHWASLV